MSARRVIAIGDVHGMLVELCDLLDKIGYASDDDRLILVGDLIDRGPYSPGVVKFAREQNIEITIGNHEEKALRYLKYKYADGLSDADNPVKVWPDRAAELSALTVEDVEYLRSAPKYIHLNEKTPELKEGWLAVHAGFEANNLPLEAQDRDKVCRVSHLNKLDGSYATRSKVEKKPDDCVEWMTMWNKPFHVVYGHIVHSLTTPRHVRAPNGYDTYGIDTGGCFGGRLTALIIELDGEINPVRTVQVSARREYCKRRGLNDD